MTQPAPLPNFFQIVAPINGLFNQTYTVLNDDGTAANIDNKVFELVVRDRNTNVAIFSIDSTSVTSYGTIAVTSSNSSFQIMVNPAATALLTEVGGNYAIWMDQNLPDAVPLVAGVFYGRNVANPI